jgi:hypothetical protein
MFNPLQNYLYGVDGGGIAYTGNWGGPSATPVANTPLPNQYNNTPTRGGQAALGFFANNSSMSMSPDGTKAYCVNHNGVSEGYTNDSVGQYNLDTPWDLLTMGGVAGQSPSLNSFPSFTDSSPVQVYFSPNGINMYVAGRSSFRIYRYTLATPWVVSTASAVISIASGYASLSGVSFSTDGLKMFITESTNMRRFTLSSAWDITTATNDGVVLNMGGSQFFFKEDGLSFMCFNGTRIRRYFLTSAWDITTYIAFTQSIDLSTLTYYTSNNGGLYISPDGLYFFQSGYTGYSIKRFEFKRAWKVD